MLMEYVFHLIINVHFRITTLILQLDLDVAPELIILREYRYHRD
jgi:hypothetical protein